jgi:hypothetical protein
MRSAKPAESEEVTRPGGSSTNHFRGLAVLYGAKIEFRILMLWIRRFLSRSICPFIKHLAVFPLAILQISDTSDED